MWKRYFSNRTIVFMQELPMSQRRDARPQHVYLTSSSTASKRHDLCGFFNKAITLHSEGRGYRAAGSSYWLRSLERPSCGTTNENTCSPMPSTPIFMYIDLNCHQVLYYLYVLVSTVPCIALHCIAVNVNANVKQRACHIAFLDIRHQYIIAG